MELAVIPPGFINEDNIIIITYFLTANSFLSVFSVGTHGFSCFNVVKMVTWLLLLWKLE